MFEKNSDELFGLMSPDLKESLNISNRSEKFTNSNLIDIVDKIIKLE